MSGLGYIQWRPFLDGAVTLDEVITAIQHETHAFVRRQYTWFNGHDSGDPLVEHEPDHTGQRDHPGPAVALERRGLTRVCGNEQDGPQAARSGEREIGSTRWIAPR